MILAFFIRSYFPLLTVGGTLDQVGHSTPGFTHEQWRADLGFPTIGAVTATGRALVHPAVDGWLLGGIAIVVWVLVNPLGGGSAALAVSGPIGAIFLALGAAHFGATYHLAYGLPAELRRRYRWALVGVPVLLGLATVAIVTAHQSGAHRGATSAVRWLFIVIFTLTGWHYVKQAYGVALLAGRARGIRLDRSEALTLRYAFYPVWAVTLARIWVDGAGASYRGVDVTVNALPAATGTVLRVIAVAGLVVAVGTMVRAGLRVRAVPPLGMWTPYVAGGLWLLYSPGVIGASVMLAGLHGLQYLACVHRAEVDWAREQGETNLGGLWISIIGGALAGGLLMATWLPSMLDASIATPGAPGLYGSLVFIALNLHHYAIDAAIWRHDGPHLARISKGPQLVQAGPAVTAGVPGSVSA